MDRFGNWIIDGGGRLTSGGQDPLFVLSPGEDEEGAIRFGSVRIGNGDILAEQIEFFGTNGVFYTRNSSSKFSY